MKLAVFLAAMVKPLAAKLLLALGFQVVTITGMVATIATLKGTFMSHIGAVPAAGMQLALLGGAGEAIGIIFGAIATRIALWQIQQGTKILGVSS